MDEKKAEILAKPLTEKPKTTPTGQKRTDKGPETSNTCKKAKSVEKSAYQSLISLTGAQDVLQRNSEQQEQV